MNTTEAYLSRDREYSIYQCPFNITDDIPKFRESSGTCTGPLLAALNEQDAVRLFGKETLPSYGKHVKVRIATEVIPEIQVPPPKPRLCWFERNGVKWSGFLSDNLYRVASEEFGYTESEFTHKYLEDSGITVHWYDEEPANCE